LRAAEPLALLFTDVVLPGGMNGVEIAARAKRIQPRIKVLYTTGYAEEDVIANSELASGAGLINKPYRPTGLLEKLRALLNHKA
jgi:CheY-like chemotaxis protein